MVSLRLTDSEYKKLLRVRDRKGVESLSELARVALLEMTQESETGLGLRIRSMEKRLDEIESAVGFPLPRRKPARKRG